jgi:DNA-binding CsgD family transcriptional regulator
LTGVLNADHALLIVSNNAAGNPLVAASTGMRINDFERFLSPEARRYSDLYLRALPSEKAVRSSDYIPVRTFERSTFYNKYVRPLDGFYSVSAHQRSSALSTAIAACRPRRSGDFAPAAASAMQLVLPHLATAVQLRHRLQVAENRYARVAGALDQLHDGVIVVDAEASIVFANRAGESVLGAGDGLCLGEGRLAAVHPATNAALRWLIAQSTRALNARRPGGSLQIMRGEERDPIHAFVAPFKARDNDMWRGDVGESLAIVFLTDPETAHIADKNRWRQQFGLTAAEANLALEIVKGDGRRASAERLGISVSTARAHLTHVFEKTGTRRQAALVRLLLSRGGDRAEHD